MAVGARCVERERHFNNQRGRDIEDDEVPYADELPDLGSARAEYYELRGWSDDGMVPDGAADSGDVPADD